MPPKKKVEGIKLTFEITNESELKIAIEIEKPCEEAQAAFAWLLNQLENGEVYDTVISKFKDMTIINPELNQFFETVFSNKHIIDMSRDKLLVRPSEVFSLRNK